MVARDSASAQSLHVVRSQALLSFDELPQDLRKRLAGGQFGGRNSVSLVEEKLLWPLMVQEAAALGCLLQEWLGQVME